MRSRAHPLARTAALVLAALLCACSGPRPDDATERPESLAGTTTSDAGTLAFTITAGAAGAIEVGRPVRLDVVFSPATQPGAPPELPESLGFFDVRIAEQPRWDGSAWRASYELRSLEAGDVELPATDLPLSSRSGGADGATITSPALVVTVRSLLGDDATPTDFADIKGAVTLADQPSRVPIVVAGAAGAVLLAIIAMLVVGRLRGTRPTPSAEERALAALAALRGERLHETGRIHEFYVRLTDIVRVSIEARWGIRAPERTTQEFLREAARSPTISEAERSTLGAFLRDADLVKFAGAAPDASTCVRSLELAEHFVRSGTSTRVPAGGAA
jgi:hypothetical protein